MEENDLAGSDEETEKPDAELTDFELQTYKKKIRYDHINTVQAASQTANFKYLNKLRELLVCPKVSNAPLTGFIIPNSDPHMSYHLIPSYRRILLISGFTGCGGFGIITAEDAVLWVDEISYTKAVSEVGPYWTVYSLDVRTAHNSLLNWLIKNVHPGSKIGCDPKIFEFKKWLNLEEELSKKKILLVATENLIDMIWKKQPPRTNNPIMILKTPYLGKSMKKKISSVRQHMAYLDVDAVTINTLDEIAWLLNMRGSDVPYDGVFLGFLIIMKHHIHLFIDNGKFTIDIDQYMAKYKVKFFIHKYQKYYDFLKFLSSATVIEKICITTSSSYEEFSCIPNHKRYVDLNFISLEKCIKNSAETKGMILANLRHSVAMCRLMFWLEKMVPKGKVTEARVVEQIEKLNQDEEDYVGPSYRPIVASGRNTSIMHYPTPVFSDVNLQNDIFVIDTGAHYLCGTTSMNRTMHFGNPTTIQMETYTIVCKGLLRLMKSKFPVQTLGNSLDSVVRIPFWKKGIDYIYNSGSGIGAYLKVHEGPITLNRNESLNYPGIQANMFFKVGPGYHHEEEFGVRLKNVLQVVPVETEGNATLEFSTINFCPINTKLLLRSLLSPEDLCCLDKYHDKCRTVIGPILLQRGFKEVYHWLTEKTQPLSTTFS